MCLKVFSVPHFKFMEKPIIQLVSPTGSTINAFGMQSLGALMVGQEKAPNMRYLDMHGCGSLTKLDLGPPGSLPALKTLDLRR